METEQVKPTESFTFTTRLRAGMEGGYERLHRAIPAELDAAMRAAGVLGWQIRRQGKTLTHAVTARDREQMNTILEQDPVNRAWQREVAPFIDADESASASTPAPATAPAGPGVLIWDLSWPTR